MQRRALVAIASVIAAGLVLTGAGLAAATPRPADGDAVAARQADQLAESMVSSLQRQLAIVGSAAPLVAGALEDLHRHFGAAGTVVDAYAIDWFGDAYVAGATLDVRFDVTVGDVPSMPLVAGNTEGTASGCWHYLVLRAQEPTVQRSRLDCPSTPAPQQPSSNAVNLHVVDIISRLRAVLGTAAVGSADLSTVDQIAHETFPDAFVDIGVRGGDDVIVISIAVRNTDLCVVAVRSPDGAISIPSLDRRWSPPRQGDCSPELYTNPPAS